MTTFSSATGANTKITSVSQLLKVELAKHRTDRAEYAAINRSGGSNESCMNLRSFTADFIVSKTKWREYVTHTEDCHDASYEIDRMVTDRVKDRVYNSEPDVSVFLPMPRYGGWARLKATFCTMDEERTRWLSEPFPHTLAEFEEYQEDVIGHGSHVVQTDFLVTVHRGTKSKRFIPTFKGFWDGCHPSALWMHDTPEAVSLELVDRLWKLSRRDDDTFTGLPWCGCCGKALTDSVSQTLGVGPVCARQGGFPHGETFAGKVVLHRANSAALSTQSY